MALAVYIQYNLGDTMMGAKLTDCQSHVKITTPQDEKHNST